MSLPFGGMHSYDRRQAAAYRTLYARLLVSMSVDEARETLGFPPGYSPSPGEIAKAYKRKAIENHPDRGGSHEKMVEVNVAKDILEGKQRAGRPTQPDDYQSGFTEFARKKNVAVETIDRAARSVGSAADIAVKAADIGRGKLHLRDFFTEEFADALDKMQDMIEAEDKPHPDMKKAGALCGSLSNKALRLGKRYLTLLKLQGNAIASVTGMSGSDPLTYDLLAKLYMETNKFVLAFTDMWQESRKLIGLIRTSENVPIEWDDIYSHPHNVLDSFTGKVYGFGSFNDAPLKRFEQELAEAVKTVGYAVMSVAPDEWKNAPSADRWAYPQDFEWATETVMKAHYEPSTKNAYSYGR